MAHKPKVFIVWPLYKKFADPDIKYPVAIFLCYTLYLFSDVIPLHRYHPCTGISLIDPETTQIKAVGVAYIQLLLSGCQISLAGTGKDVCGFLKSWYDRAVFSSALNAHSNAKFHVPCSMYKQKASKSPTFVLQF